MILSHNHGSNTIHSPNVSYSDYISYKPDILFYINYGCGTGKYDVENCINNTFTFNT